MKKQIMKRAWEIVRNAIANHGGNSRMYLSSALRTAWSENRAPKEYKNVIINTYSSFNQRRYSNPWVALVEDGKYNFSKKIGEYTGRYGCGEAGELYIYAPVEGQIYAYGQKDYRGKNTEIIFATFANGHFVTCDKLGRVA